MKGRLFQRFNGVKMGFLKCKSCGESYQLKPGESPDDFESCSCGGELEFYDSIGERTVDYGSSSGFKGLVIKLVIFLIAFYIVYMLMGGFLRELSII